MSEALEIDEQQTEEVVEESEQSIDEQIEALIAGEVAETPEMEEEEADTASAEPEGEVEEVEIDYDLKVPLPDEREPVTISELKDRYVESERREAEFIRREAELNTERDELANLMHAAGEIPPELKERARQKQQEHLEREHQAMLRSKPEWNDPAVFNKARDRIVETAHIFGFTDDELARANDHRLVNMIDALGALLETQEKSVKSIEPDKPPRRPKPKVAPKATKKSNVEKLYQTALETGDQRAGDAAVAAMLGDI